MKTVFKITAFLMICPFWVIAQVEKPPYPKDTIYVRYETVPKSNWNAKFERKYKGNPGIFFNIEKKQGDMTLFYPYSQQADTLCSVSLKDFHFSDLKEINKKRNKWIFDHKRPPADRNGVFQTYVIEKINGCKLVKYPVIWRNEGVRP